MHFFHILEFIKVLAKSVDSGVRLTQFQSWFTLYQLRDLIQIFCFKFHHRIVIRTKKIEICKVLRTVPDPSLSSIEVLVIIIVVVIYHDIIFYAFFFFNF